MYYAWKFLRSILLVSAIRLMEFIIIAAVGAVIYSLLLSSDQRFDAPDKILLFGSASLTVILVQFFGGYRVSALRNPMATLGRVYGAWTANFAAFAVIAFLANMGDQFSRSWILTWFMVTLFVIAIFRVGISLLVHRWSKAGIFKRTVAIVGVGDHTADLISALETDPYSDTELLGIFDDRLDNRIPKRIAGYPVLGTTKDLLQLGRTEKLDVIIMDFPITAEQRVLQLLKEMWVLPVDIRLATHSTKFPFPANAFSYIGDIPFFILAERPISDGKLLLKSLFDRVVGIFVLLIFSPLMLITALAIRIESPGPILFKQDRYGFNNRVISVFKFRSLYHDKADPMAKQIVTQNDPRVTRVGKIIRRASIDELPQLFNVVFKGDLSLVGPRPHPTKAHFSDRLFEEVADGYFARHRVKPGITGWAQVNGWRGEANTKEKLQKRIEHDLYYIENWSLLFDIYILIITPFKIIKGDNAY